LSREVCSLAHGSVAVFGDEGRTRNPEWEGRQVILRRRRLRSLLAAVVLLGGAGMTIRASSAIELFAFNLQGSYTLGWYGADLSAPPRKSAFALVGVLSLDGKRAITAGSITYNDAGTYCEGVVTEGGKYSILPDGEGELNFNIAVTSGTCPITQFEFPISIANMGGSKVARSVSMGAGGGLAANLTGSGLALLQASNPITLADGSLHNGYSFSWFGHDFFTVTSGNNAFGAVGAIGFDKGKILGGSIAYNDGGAICRAGGLSGVGGLSGAGLSGSYTVGADGEALINLEIVGATGTCPLTSFVLTAVLSDIGSSGSAHTIQFLSASAAGPDNAGSPKVVVSGTAIKVGRFILNQ
jgi:hypothetical protein